MDSKQIKLGDMINIKHGYAFKGEYFSNQNNGFCLLTPGNFQIGGGFKENDKFYTGPIPDDYILKPNDLIITMTDLSKNGDTLGYSALVPATEQTYLHNQRIGLVQFLSDEIDKYYLHYLLSRREYQKYIVNTSSGSTVRHTSPTKILSYELSLPPLSEQKRIANILSSFDNKIEQLKKENNILENIAQSIFKEWFVKYNFPNNDGKPYKDSGGKMIDSELGLIPDGWRVGKLGEFGKIICGKTPSKSNPNFFGGQYPFIKIPDMQDMFVTKTEDSLTELGIKQLGSKLLPANSISVSCIATIGKVSITTEESFTNQQINTIIPKEASLEYLFFTLKSMKGYLEQIGNRGSTTFNINTNMFTDLPIISPPENILSNYHISTKPAFSTILKNVENIKTLSKTKSILLKNLMK